MYTDRQTVEHTDTAPIVESSQSGKEEKKKTKRERKYPPIIIITTTKPSSHLDICWPSAAQILNTNPPHPRPPPSPLASTNNGHQRK